MDGLTMNKTTALTEQPVITAQLYKRWESYKAFLSYTQLNMIKSERNHEYGAAPKREEKL